MALGELPQCWTNGWICAQCRMVMRAFVCITLAMWGWSGPDLRHTPHSLHR